MSTTPSANGTADLVAADAIEAVTGGHHRPSILRGITAGRKLQKQDDADTLLYVERHRAERITELEAVLEDLKEQLVKAHKGLHDYEAEETIWKGWRAEADHLRSEIDSILESEGLSVQPGHNPVRSQALANHVKTLRARMEEARDKLSGFRDRDEAHAKAQADLRADIVVLQRERDVIKVRYEAFKLIHCRLMEHMLETNAA